MSANTKETNPHAAPLALNMDEAAHELGLSRCYLYALIKSGRLRTFKVGRARRVSREALVDFIKSCEKAEAA